MRRSDFVDKNKNKNKTRQDVYKIANTGHVLAGRRDKWKAADGPAQNGRGNVQKLADNVGTKWQTGCVQNCT